ncbi:phosphatase [Rhodococcus sp. NCIMB 12038]|nr:phosphatase [Rhodococcus sp. NCIMB 12038]
MYAARCENAERRCSSGGALSASTAAGADTAKVKQSPPLLLLSKPSAYGHHHSLIGRAHDAAADIHQSTGATLAVALLGAGAAVFLAATTWRAVAATNRRSATSPLIGLQILGLTVALIALAYEVRVGALVTTADPVVLGWFADHRSEWVTGPAIAITDAGGPVGTVLMAVVLGALLSRRARSLVPGLILIGTVGVAAAASTVTKAVVGRSRPPIVSQVLLETDHSFPSGHVTGAMVLFTMVAVILGYGSPAARRGLLLVAAFTVTVVVAVTRLYLGEHWLTDVIGGILLGGLAALIGSELYGIWMRRASDRLHSVVEVDPRHAVGATEAATTGRAA